MASNISFNPVIQTVAAGSFSVQSDGYVQGVMMDDPAVRYALAGGILNSSETLPMWGGILLYTDIPGASGGPSQALGTLVGRATTVANGLGFSVFNQAANWITTPQSQAPSAGAGMTVPYFRFGSGARIAVACDPALASLEGGLTNQQVSWDFNNQQLVPYNAAWAANAITAASWAGGNVTFTTTSAHGVSVGTWFTISGMTPSGYNGDFKAITGTTGSTLVAALATNPGAETALGTLVAGGGAINVKVLDFAIATSKTVTYDAVNNLVNWNATGSCALILI